MGKYVFVYVGGDRPESEEEGQRVMAAWREWLGGMGDAVVDWGSPFGASSAVRGGPLSGLTGYSVVTARDMDDAIRLAEGCPIFANNGGIEVYETMAMNMVGGTDG
jgi:hypothetical protein